MTPEEFGFKERNIWSQLNWDLAEKNELSHEVRQLIIDCHVRRVVVFEQMAAIDKEDKPRLRQYAAEVEDLEFEMQDHWQFKHDKDYHTWWIRVPHCRCPGMDNSDPMYFGNRVIMGDCPVHGGISHSSNGGGM